jgi:hypothetical protein
MGGRGSGCHKHYWRPRKKAVVESCRIIDANHWSREGILKHGVWLSGSMTWTSHGQPGFVVHIEVSTLHPAHLFVRLRYSWVWTATGQQGSADYRVGLTTTGSKGRRWWFLCPMLVNGAPCNARVGKLYQPSLDRRFGCRKCHNLTYTSCQKSRRKANPDWKWARWRRAPAK